MRRYINNDTVKVTGVERYHELVGEFLTMSVIMPAMFAFSPEPMRNALKKAGINPYDVVFSIDTTAGIMRVAFVMCEDGTTNKLKSFFKL